MREATPEVSIHAGWAPLPRHVRQPGSQPPQWPRPSPRSHTPQHRRLASRGKPSIWRCQPLRMSLNAARSAAVEGSAPSPCSSCHCLAALISSTAGGWGCGGDAGCAGAASRQHTRARPAALTSTAQPRPAARAAAHPAAHAAADAPHRAGRRTVGDVRVHMVLRRRQVHARRVLLELRPGVGQPGRGAVEGAGAQKMGGETRAPALINPSIDPSIHQPTINQPTNQTNYHSVRSFTAGRPPCFLPQVVHPAVHSLTHSPNQLTNSSQLYACSHRRSCTRCSLAQSINQSINQPITLPVHSPQVVHLAVGLALNHAVLWHGGAHIPAVAGVGWVGGEPAVQYPGTQAARATEAQPPAQQQRRRPGPQHQAAAQAV